MKYLVISPEYQLLMPILEDGTGPTESTCDVVEVEAQNKRQACILGLRELKKIPRGWINWYRDSDSNPFVGLKVEAAE